MKIFVLRLLLCVLVQSAAICGAVYWQTEAYGGNPIGVLLAWPAVWLASVGMSHTWPLALVMLLVLPVASVLLLRKRRALLCATITALLTLAFCGAGIWRARHTSKTKPSVNPYLAGSQGAAKYSEGYGLGFGSAMTGTLATHCFRPEDETHGYYQGQEDGMRIWSRAFGLPEEGIREWARRSAAIDGVRPELLGER